MIHRLRPGRVSGIPCRFRILIALGSCLAIPIGVSAQSASAGPIELWGTFDGNTWQIQNGQDMWIGSTFQKPRIDVLFGGSEGTFDLSLTSGPNGGNPIAGNQKLPLNFFLKEADNHQNGVFGDFLWETSFTLDFIDGIDQADEVIVTDLSITHIARPHAGELPNNKVPLGVNLSVKGTDPAPPGPFAGIAKKEADAKEPHGDHDDVIHASLIAWKQPVQPFPAWNDQFTEWSLQMDAFHTPEIDPAGLGSVMGLVLGACGLMERRLRVTRAPGAAARG